MQVFQVYAIVFPLKLTELDQHYLTTYLWTARRYFRVTTCGYRNCSHIHTRERNLWWSEWHRNAHSWQSHSRRRGWRDNRDFQRDSFGIGVAKRTRILRCCDSHSLLRWRLDRPIPWRHHCGIKISLLALDILPEPPVRRCFAALLVPFSASQMESDWIYFIRAGAYRLYWHCLTFGFDCPGTRCNNMGGRVILLERSTSPDSSHSWYAGTRRILLLRRQLCDSPGRTNPALQEPHGIDCECHHFHQCSGDLLDYFLPSTLFPGCAIITPGKGWCRVCPPNIDRYSWCRSFLNHSIKVGSLQIASHQRLRAASHRVWSS